MPMITNTGQGRHRFGVGQGLYTATDLFKGPNPTPSQAARGVDPAGIDARWWALDADTKRAWAAVATPPMSGRKLFSTVNRLRWNDYTTPTDTPPPGPYVPQSGLVTNVSAVSDYDGLGVGAYVWSFPGVTPNQGMELAIYKPAVGTPGAGGAGAYWLLASFSGLDDSPIYDFGSLFGGFQRGPDLIYWTAPTPSLGAAIRVRFLTCTDTHYPGIPQYFSLVVQP